MSEFEPDEEWDEETVLDLRRFAFEQALTAHIHKRDAPTDIAAVFVLADRIVAYCLGDLSP